MKPYGQKHEKSLKGLHSSDHCSCEICNTSGWKVLKSRERKPADPEFHLNYTNIQFEDIEDMVFVERFEKEGKEFFRATCNSLKLNAIGMTPDHAIQKAYEEFVDLMNDI